MNNTIIDPSVDREVLMQTWICNVRFQIPSELRNREYIRWLTELFQEFLGFCHPTKNASEQMRFYFPEEVGSQGGVGMIYLGDTFFHGCKLYAYDGESRRSPGDWKGIMMRDHEDMRSQVEPIYRMANLFERFLCGKGISFQRIGRLVGGEEVLQELKLGVIEPHLPTRI